MRSLNTTETPIFYLNVFAVSKGNRFFTFISDMDSCISEFGQSHCCKYRFQSKTNNRTANSVDPDETNEPSHLDLHCLHCVAH